MEQETKDYIDLTAENIGLKVEKVVAGLIQIHATNCANQFNGRLEMVENAIVHLAKLAEAKYDNLSPLLAVFFKNWKIIAVIFLVVGSCFRTSRSDSKSVEQIKEIIKKVNTIEEKVLSIPQKTTDNKPVR